MIPNTNAPQLVRELQAVLDDQIELLEQKRTELAGLSAAILERDDAAMETLMGEMDRTMRRQAESDLKLAALRRSLGDALGLPARAVKLSTLIDRLGGQAADALGDRRRQIIHLAGQLRRQHAATTMLLRESARINRLILEGLGATGRELTTYDADGRDQWRDRTGLVDTEC